MDIFILYLVKMNCKKICIVNKNIILVTFLDW